MTGCDAVPGIPHDTLPRVHTYTGGKAAREAAFPFSHSLSLLPEILYLSY